jgi:hypothetical protein
MLKIWGRVNSVNVKKGSVLMNWPGIRAHRRNAWRGTTPEYRK